MCENLFAFINDDEVIINVSDFPEAIQTNAITFSSTFDLLESVQVIRIIEITIKTKAVAYLNVWMCWKRLVGSHCGRPVDVTTTRAGVGKQESYH